MDPTRTGHRHNGFSDGPAGDDRDAILLFTDHLTPKTIHRMAEGIMKLSTLHSRDSATPEDGLTRRRFLTRLGVGALGLAWALPGRPRQVIAKQPDAASLPIALLERSPFVYVSPLLQNGKESSCHAELWFAWIEDSIIVTVAKDRWKATALTRGLNGARIWVGDHGRWKNMIGLHNEAYLEAPNFFATAERVEDKEMIERLLTVYAKKYPDEIARWSDRMRSGNADGSRIMIRYRPNTGGSS